MIINWWVTLSTLDLQRKICLKIQSIPRTMLKVCTLLQSFIGTYIGNFFFLFWSRPIFVAQESHFCLQIFITTKDHTFSYILFRSNTTKFMIFARPGPSAQMLNIRMCNVHTIYFTIHNSNTSLSGPESLTTRIIHTLWTRLITLFEKNIGLLQW